jgi:hypothetical protein
VIFSWNRANTEHIAKHGVKRSEAEQVVRGARSPWPTKSEDEKRLVWGQTAAGRYLQVTFFYPKDEDVDPKSLTLFGHDQLVGRLGAGDLCHPRARFGRR